MPRRDPKSLGPGLWAILLCLPLSAFALEWPLENPKPAILFGSSVAGSFFTGMALASEGELALSADEGEVSFVNDQGVNGQSRIPSTLGSYVVVDHPRGIAAVYSQLSPGTAAATPSKVNRGSIVGRAGASGWTAGQGVGFAVFDRSALRWVNPLLLLPEIKDKGSPQIKSALLLRSGKRFALGETKTLPQGKYDIAVDCGDLLEGSWTSGPSAPYTLRLLIDGAKAAEFSFDTAESRQGRFLISSGSPKPYADTYLDDGKIILASRLFSSGKSVIQIMVKDYGGNQKQASWSILFE